MTTEIVQPSMPPEAAEVETLRRTIHMTDCLAQAKLSSISGIAHLALIALRNEPRGGKAWNAIAQALTTIETDADDLMNSINAAAEDAGCNFREVSHD